YNMPVITVIEGEINKKRIREIFETLIARHESFRTSFETVNGESVQRIHRSVEFEIQNYELNREEIKEEKGGEETQTREKLIINNFIRPFDLSMAPLLRVGLIKKEKKGDTTITPEYLLLIDMHHIVSDGVSVAILMKDFTALYKGERLKPVEFSYKDYTQWLNSPGQQKAREQQEVFWLKEFEEEIPVLEMPIDYPRKTKHEFDGELY
ncbi:MAG: polyketide synthase, partial [bacterium]|nr:polyketide synthase [bacterium]